MDREQALALLRARGDEIRQHGVTSLFLFGSTARGDSRPDSDVDLFVDYDLEHFGLIELIRLETSLAEKLGRPVDLTTREGLHPLLRPEIEREAVRVF